MELEELRILVDEVRVDGTVEELLILQNIQQKRYIRLYPTHTEFTESAVHLGARRLKITGVGDYLMKQRLLSRFVISELYFCQRYFHRKNMLNLLFFYMFGVATLLCRLMCLSDLMIFCIRTTIFATLN